MVSNLRGSELPSRKPLGSVSSALASEFPIDRDPRHRPCGYWTGVKIVGRVKIWSSCQNWRNAMVITDGEVTE